MPLKKIQQELENLANQSQAKILSGFFKTGPGQYGEGDIFRGIKAPQTQAVVKKFYATMSIDDTVSLLHSPFHEDRLCALLILVKKMQQGDKNLQKSIYTVYLENTAYINNWDLVDLSAHHITGAYLLDKSKTPLYKLAKSPLLWERRIAILSTFHYIKLGIFNDAFTIIEQLLDDKEDLIHKATGWMLREIGKRKQTELERFLKKHYHNIPRTTLRYAIERFPEALRQQYLKGTF